MGKRCLVVFVHVGTCSVITCVRDLLFRSNPGPVLNRGHQCQIRATKADGFSPRKGVFHIPREQLRGGGCYQKSTLKSIIYVLGNQSNIQSISYS